MEFEERKRRALHAMEDPHPDKSPKGTIDAPIVSLLDAINRRDAYFTTSSCSGRISIFCHPEKKIKKSKAGGGSWILVSHDPVKPDAVIDLLFGGNTEIVEDGTLVFRFEPFILAVECKDAASAQSLVAIAISCGFRESGITNLSRRAIVAIRCSIRLEVPLGSIGKIMVSQEYVRYLVEIANGKMEQNRQRTDAFYQALACESALSSDVPVNIRNGGRKSVHKKILKQHEQWQNTISNDSLGNSAAEISGQLEALDLSSCDNVETESVKSCSNTKESGKSPFSVQSITISGEPIEKLHRWGHSACTLNFDNRDQIIVFGGFGGLGRHARRNDTLMLDPQLGFVRSVCAEGPPSPRLGHTSSMVGKLMLVIGGRGDPTQIFNDVWILDVEENRWMLMSCSGSLFLERHRHSAAVLGSDIYVFGGLNNETIYSDMYVLNSKNMEWREIEIHGEKPCARHSHALVAHDSMLFMFGGYDGHKALGDFYMFNAEKSCWKMPRTSGRAPSPRFSHSMFVHGTHIGIIGGCPLKEHHEISLLDLENYVWRYVTVDNIPRDLWVRSTAIVLREDLVLVGGGASCYAFGAKFSQPIRGNISSLILCSKSSCESSGDSFDRYRNTLSLSNPLPMIEGKCFKHESAFMRIGRKYAKQVKDILKKFGWLDLSRRVISNRDDVHVLIPVSYKFFEDAAETLENGNPISGALDILLACEASVLSDDGLCREKVCESLQKKMKDAICSLLTSRGLPFGLMLEVPKRWDRLGDMVILPVTAFKDPAWDFIAQDLWPVVANSLGAIRLARQGRVLPNGTRDSSLEILVGDNGLVEHKENGITYSFDATKCMFSFGNLSEKLRMGNLDCKDEVVVDLFAGIGYFVLPFLVRAKAKLVYACEWNPHALSALRRNLEINMVADRCIVIEGDNRTTAPRGVADRVCLGLLPSSEESWLNAVRALRPGGGIMHIHGNVDDSAETTWSDYVLASINRMAESEGYSWHVALLHLERVKWYAPHVRHLVSDVRCSLK